MTWRDWGSIIALTFVFWFAFRPSPKRRRQAPKPDVDDPPAVEIEWRPEVSVFDDPERFGYKVFTSKHDWIVEAADLPRRPGADKRAKLLDRTICRYAETTIRLTDLLHKRGVGEDLAASILIDHSGSMRAHAVKDRRRYGSGIVVPVDSSAVLAAGLAVSTAASLMNCGAQVEVLGFTTREWRGGEARKEWIEVGRPPRPGRLNGLLHIIYRAADEMPDILWKHRLEALLNPYHLKENIDGEAIAWARSRLLALPASERLLIVISDGAPIDDSTLNENGLNYLQRHVLRVIEDIQRRGDLRIIGFGVGHEMWNYIPQSVALGGKKPSFTKQIQLIADLIVPPIREPLIK